MDVYQLDPHGQLDSQAALFDFLVLVLANSWAGVGCLGGLELWCSKGVKGLMAMAMI